MNGVIALLILRMEKMTLLNFIIFFFFFFSLVCGKENESFGKEEGFI